MSRSKSSHNGGEKLTKKLKITFIIFVLSGLIALFVIFNKGVLFGFRLVPVSDEAIAETHTIELKSDKTTLPEGGETANLLVTLDGVDSLDGYEITSSDEEVAKVVGNTIISQEAGTATITAKSTEFGITSEVTVDVVEPITSITLSSQYRIITIDEESQLSFKYKPSTATAKIVYKSSDEKILTVDQNGVAKGVSYGVAEITATDEITGYYDTFKITVR